MSGDPRYANGSLRRKYRKRLLALYDTCARCGRTVRKDHDPNDELSAEVDEKTPVWLGGDPLDFNNLQILCRKCNREKYEEERRMFGKAREDEIKTLVDW